MSILYSIIAALWLLFVVYWAIAALRAKRTVKTSGWWAQAALRGGLIVLVIIASRLPAVRHAAAIVHAYKAGDIAFAAAGTALVAVGLGLALVARTYIGRNWGAPMSRKENPELVTCGPYAFIRHPIYSGIMLAMFGSMVAISLLWLLPLVLFGAYFIYSARCEEKLMSEQFPDAYPAYMRRTKMLVPFVV